jgi:hypothetical protein
VVVSIATALIAVILLRRNLFVQATPPASAPGDSCHRLSGPLRGIELGTSGRRPAAFGADLGERVRVAWIKVVGSLLGGVSRTERGNRLGLPGGIQLDRSRDPRREYYSTIFRLHGK